MAKIAISQATVRVAAMRTKPGTLTNTTAVPATSATIAACLCRTLRRDDGSKRHPEYAELHS